MAVFILMFFGSVANNHHVPAPAEIIILFSALRDALVTGIIFWLLYVAIETLVRRRSPATLNSINRLLAGKLNDPLVGRDLLVGLALGILGSYIIYFIPIPFIEALAPRLMPHAGGFFSLWCWQMISAVGSGLGIAIVLNVLLIVFRRQWLSLSVFVVAMTMRDGRGRSDARCSSTVYSPLNPRVHSDQIRNPHCGRIHICSQFAALFPADD